MAMMTIITIMEMIGIGLWLVDRKDDQAMTSARSSINRPKIRNIRMLRA